MSRKCYFALQDCAYKLKVEGLERICATCRHSSPPEDLVADKDDYYVRNDRICVKCKIPDSVCDCRKLRWKKKRSGK